MGRTGCALVPPPLRHGHQKIAEDLHARDRFEFFRIDKVGIERERVVPAEELHEPAVLLDQVVR